MSNKRDAVLEGALQAARLHKQLGIRDKIDHTGGAIDVFGVIAELDVPLLFKKLDGLLGAYVPSPSPGILVTTERQLSIQRYTAAHELGHFFMHHKVSLDDEEILSRTPFVNSGNLMEVAANTFAAMFLMPDWLLRFHAEKQGWGQSDLNRPANVYQLCLRLGTSYEATCRVLNRHGIISSGTMNALLAVQPKTLKQELLGSSVPMANWRPNVWLITERDSGVRVHGEPEDLFIVRLREDSGSGYLWDLEQMQQAGFVVVSDTRDFSSADENIGGPVERVLTAKAQDELFGTIELSQNRPWDPDDQLARVAFSYEVYKERGISRVARQRAAAA
jgi:Zn-dependent peptidase ImmA (M78 family)/predicted secreted protein